MQLEARCAVFLELADAMKYFCVLNLDIAICSSEKNKVRKCFKYVFIGLVYCKHFNRIEKRFDKPF